MTTNKFDAWKTIENNVGVGGNGTFLIIRKNHVISTEALRQELSKSWNYAFLDLIQKLFGLKDEIEAAEVRNALTDWVRKGEQLRFPNKGDQPKAWWDSEGTPKMPW